MEDKNRDIFKDLAGGNVLLGQYIDKLQNIWQRHANRRTGVILTSVVIIWIIFYIFALRPPSEFPSNELVNIKKGQDFATIAAELESEGVVRSASIMKLVAKLYGAERSVHHGDYLFKEPINMLEIIKRLNNGSFGIDPVAVRVVEGSTVADIAELLDAKILRFDKETFLNIASKHEGYLYPDTYYFLPNAPEGQIVDAMRDNFYKHYEEVAEAAAKTGYSLHEIVTLASILELEASKYEDRRKIAGVMYNRLEINMPLQVDVSFVYIMDKGTFDITREDLKHDSPYNTYVHKGLPPGPIGAPSTAALRAAVDPVPSSWLFYLADSSGTTHYSDTYKQHLVKKRRYIDNR